MSPWFPGRSRSLCDLTMLMPSIELLSGPPSDGEHFAAELAQPREAGPHGVLNLHVLAAGLEAVVAGG